LACASLIEVDEFERERKRLKAQSAQLTIDLATADRRLEDVLNEFMTALSRMADISGRFLRGTPEERREILAVVGSNHVLGNGKPSLKAESWLEPITKRYPKIEAEFRRLEPRGILAGKHKTDALASVDLTWFTILDEVWKRFQKRI
jgi:hypothetical protein